MNKFCLFCGNEIINKRIDCIYCSPKCKKRKHYLDNKEIYIEKSNLWKKRKRHHRHFRQMRKGELPPPNL